MIAIGTDAVSSQERYSDRGRARLELSFMYEESFGLRSLRSEMKVYWEIYHVDLKSNSKASIS